MKKAIAAMMWTPIEGTSINFKSKGRKISTFSSHSQQRNDDSRNFMKTNKKNINKC